MKRKYILFLPVMVLLLSGCKSNKNEEAGTKTAPAPREIAQIVGIASIEPKARIVSLFAETAGIVKNIHHDIGDTVKAGDIIIELTNDIEKAQLAQAQSKISTQIASINAAGNQLASQKVRMENSQTNYNRNKKLMESGAVTRQQLEDSRFDYEARQKDASAAEATLAQQEKRLKELQTDIKYFEEVVKRKYITAPSDGRILSIDVKIGTDVSPSQALGDFAPKGPLMALTEVDELFANEVKEGMKAYIRPQGRTDTLATGTIFLASPYLRKKSLFSDAATNMEDRRVREVRVLLDADARVLIGSRVECVILVK